MVDPLSVLNAGAPRAAVIGAGFIAGVHLDALRRLRIPVQGIASIDKAASEAAAAAHGVPRGYGSLEELLADESVDVVHVTSPNHLHYQHVMAVLEADKHVICEKPLAVTVSQGRRMAALAAERGLVAGVCFHYRFFALSRHVRSLIESGEVSRPHLVTGHYLQDWLAKPTDWNWRLDPELEPAGIDGEPALRAMADIGSHWLDLAEFLTTRKVAQVCADLATLFPERLRPSGPVETFAGKEKTAAGATSVAIASDDFGSVLLRFDQPADDGASPLRGSMTVSQVSPGRKNQLAYEIDALEHALAWNSERCEEMWIGRRDGANRELLRDPTQLAGPAGPLALPGGHAQGLSEAFSAMFADMYGAVVDARGGRVGEAPQTRRHFATFDDGVHSLEIERAIARSHRDRRWYGVEGIGEDSTNREDSGVTP